MVRPLWIELNLGAPHGRESGAASQITASDAVRNYVRTVRRAISLPLAVKLTEDAEKISLGQVSRGDGLSYSAAI